MGYQTGICGVPDRGGVTDRNDGVPDRNGGVPDRNGGVPNRMVGF